MEILDYELSVPATFSVYFSFKSRVLAKVYFRKICLKLVAYLLLLDSQKHKVLIKYVDQKQLKYIKKKKRTHYWLVFTRTLFRWGSYWILTFLDLVSCKICRMILQEKSLLHRIFSINTHWLPVFSKVFLVKQTCTRKWFLFTFLHFSFP